MDAQRARRARNQIFQLCHSGLDSNRLGLEAEGRLRTVVPFDRSCWHNVDPGSSMLTSVIGETAPTDPLLPVLEYGTADVNHYADLARARVPVSALRVATGGMPATSRRYREVLQPMRIEDELTASFVIGRTFWGCARLYRSGRCPPFDAVEIAFVAALAPVLAEGFRSALLAQSALVNDVTDGPGVVILNKDGSLVESITPAACALAAGSDRRRPSAGRAATAPALRDRRSHPRNCEWRRHRTDRALSRADAIGRLARPARSAARHCWEAMHQHHRRTGAGRRA